jgi:protein required for attachment to host cells
MDGGRAHLFEMRRAPRTFEKLLALESPTRQTPGRDLATDSSGRSHHRGGGTATHTKEPRVDPRDAEEIQFVDGVVTQLRQIQAERQFEELVLVADPRTLGRLRKQLDKSLTDRVSHSFNWNLAGMNAAQLQERLWSALGWSG